MQILNVTKVLIRNGEGKYLLLRGSVWPERPDRSQKPDLPGGLVDEGETHVQGAVREVKEEANIDVAESDMLLVYSTTYLHASEGESVNRHIYRVDVEGTPEVTLSWEHEAFSWVSADDLLNLEIRDPYPEVFRYLKEIGQLS